MMTASDQIDMMKRMMTTALARHAHVVPQVERAEADRLLSWKKGQRVGV